eukprot:gene13813-16048_t
MGNYRSGLKGTMTSMLALSMLLSCSKSLSIGRGLQRISRSSVRSLRMASMSTFSAVGSMDSSQYHPLSKAATDARGLAIDAVSACKSGHLGLPLGCAEVGALLWGKHLQYNSEDPNWLNRDRFVLSAGHGSMFLYGWLHLAGYALPLDEIKRFRRRGSMTPGHPEFPSSLHQTPGVEATTGPLGAGVGNAVGMALAAKAAGAKYNTHDHRIIDQYVI